jgi:hypothetical protein
MLCDICFIEGQTLTVPTHHQRRILQYSGIVYLTQSSIPSSLNNRIVAPSRKPVTLGKLLLDEECPQMRQLPYASDTENDELDEGPANDAGVCVFGLVAELGFALLCRC